MIPSPPVLGEYDGTRSGRLGAAANRAAAVGPGGAGRGGAGAGRGGAGAGRLLPALPLQEIFFRSSYLLCSGSYMIKNWLTTFPSLFP